jgi:carboxyl-terminal processing protease
VSVPTYVTREATMRISGSATDEKRVQDLFIFVRNPDAKIRPRKIYYRSNGSTKDPKVLAFEAKVPLWPGANYVSVHVRENEDVQANETVVIFRKKALAVVGAANKKDKRGR